MAPPVKTPPERWISEGLSALADGGPDAVRVEVLADRIGVSKGGFYSHFANRGALLDAMLDTWERSIVSQVIEQLDSAGGDARSRLRQLFRLAAAGPEWLRVDLAIRDWARRDRVVAERLARVDKRRMAYLRAQFREIAKDKADAEGRALLAATLWIGSHFLATGQDKRRREAAVRAALEHLLSAEGEASRRAKR